MCNNCENTPFKSTNVDGKYFDYNYYVIIILILLRVNKLMRCLFSWDNNNTDRQLRQLTLKLVSSLYERYAINSVRQIRTPTQGAIKKNRFPTLVLLENEPGNSHRDISKHLWCQRSLVQNFGPPMRSKETIELYSLLSVNGIIGSFVWFTFSLMLLNSEESNGLYYYMKWLRSKVMDFIVPSKYW